MKVCAKSSQLEKHGVHSTPWHAVESGYEAHERIRTGCGMFLTTAEVVLQEMSEPRPGLICSKQGCKKFFPQYSEPFMNGSNNGR